VGSNPTPSANNPFNLLILLECCAGPHSLRTIECTIEKGPSCPGPLPAAAAISQIVAFKALIRLSRSKAAERSPSAAVDSPSRSQGPECDTTKDGLGAPRRGRTFERELSDRIDPMKREEKITLGEMRTSGPSRLLVYCGDYRCAHSVTISSVRWPDQVRLSDLEPLFVCQFCGHRGADVRPLFDQERKAS
jgi:hypothetical protein